MVNGNGKSNTFLLGRIYERTEILPRMQKDIQDMKEKHLDNFYQIKGLKKRVVRIESTSISCILRNAGKGLLNLLIGKFKP